MADRADRLTGWLLPAILVIFLGLYVLGIRSGMEPEMSLVQSGGAVAVLAVLARMAIAVVSVERDTTEPIDVTANALSIETGEDEAEQMEAPMAMDREEESGEQQQQAVGV